MTVRTRFGACILLGCSLAAGCAQPNLWSRFGGNQTLGSPAAPASRTPQGMNSAAPSRQARPAQYGQMRNGGSSEGLLAPAGDPTLGRNARGATSAKSSFAKSMNVASGKKDASSKEKGATEHSQMTLARLNEKQKQPADSERLYLEVLKKNPQNAEAWHRLGNVCAQGAKFEKANACYERHEQLVTEPSAEFYSDKGYCLYLEHRLDEAEVALRKAIEMDRESLSSVNNLGLVLGAQQRFDEALATFKKAGTDAQAYANLAYVYTQIGELEHAEAHYNHALTLDKSLKSAANAIIQVHEKREHLTMKKPPTSLAQRPKLDGDAIQEGEDALQAELALIEAPAPSSRKAAEVEVAEIRAPRARSAPTVVEEEVAMFEPSPRQTAKTTSAPTPVRRPQVAAAPAPVSEEVNFAAEETEPLLEPEVVEPKVAELPAPRSLRTRQLAEVLPTLKATPAEAAAEVTTLVHDEAADAAPQVEAVKATKLEEESVDESLPPVYTREQYQVRRTSAEMPLAPVTTKAPHGTKAPAAPKTSHFDYGAASEAKPQAPRTFRTLFGAP